MAETLPQINPSDLADYVLECCGKMSHIKLQKLLYYVEAWHLVFFDSSLVKEKFKAWVHGPVCVSVWRKFKDQGLYGTLKPKSSKVTKQVKSVLTPDQIALVKEVLEEYGDKPAHHLEALTHSEEPWKEAREGFLPHEKSTVAIKPETMKRYYSSRLN